MTRVAAAALLLGGTGLAQAQYKWIDAKGVKQYSDRPPPPSVPLKDILKAPKGQPSAASMPAEAPVAAAASAASAAAAPPAAPAASAGVKTPSTLAEREADYLKRQKEKAEKDRKAAEEKEQRAAQADNCARAQAARRSIDSGVRLATTSATGERGYMDEAQRAAESRTVDKVLAGCK